MAQTRTPRASRESSTGLGRQIGCTRAVPAPRGRSIFYNDCRLPSRPIAMSANPAVPRSHRINETRLRQRAVNLEQPTFKAAVRRIAAACNAHGKLARGSAETEAQIEEYWQLGCKVLNLPGNDVSTYLDGMKARAARAHARLKSIGVPTTTQ